MTTFFSMDLDITIEDARELARTLREKAAALHDEDSARAQRLERIAKRVDRLLTTPVLQHDPFH